MYERFTDRARKAIQSAHEEAKRLNQGYVSTEAILLGILKESTGAAVDVLKNLDYDLEKIQIEVERNFQSSPKIVAFKKRLPFTRSVKKVIEYTVGEARSQNCRSVGTEFLLLGILHVEECGAAKVLASYYLTIDKVRLEISRLQDRAEREKINRADGGRRGMSDIPSFISHILAKIRQGVRFTKPPKRNEVTTAHHHASYEHFTDRARSVMQIANQEAKRLNHAFVETEHVLLGLVKEGSGVAANVLKNLDVDLAMLRQEVERLVIPGPGMVAMGKLPLTPTARKTIEYAIEEARVFNHNYIGTEHQLLGIMRVEDSVAAQVLRNLDIQIEDVRREILELLVE